MLWERLSIAIFWMLAKPATHLSAMAPESMQLTLPCSIHVPSNLRQLVSPEVWSSFSPVRRESFKTIFTNPNSFFYRNRPPGDPQKFGPFSAEEEAQFIERLRYFREELGIYDGLWGLFAVPLRGRLGYQCSNFYRQLVAEGKVQGRRYEMGANGKLKCTKGVSRQISRESHERLVREAVDFITACMSGTNATVEKEEPKILKDKDEPMSILRSARDAVTGEPMKYPCLDPKTGVLCDLSTWEKIFAGKLKANVATKAGSIDDLVLMTRKNFKKHLMSIMNVLF